VGLAIYLLAFLAACGLALVLLRGLSTSHAILILILCATPLLALFLGDRILKCLVPDVAIEIAHRALGGSVDAIWLASHLGFNYQGPFLED
jgi:hypothetical protein